MNFLKVGKAVELSGKNKKLYRALEILPGFLSWMTLIVLIVLSYFQPVWVAYFIIAFDVYWLLLVLYLAVHLIAAYRKLQKIKTLDWKYLCENLQKDSKIIDEENLVKNPEKARYLYKEGKTWQDMIQVVVLPTYNEDLQIIRNSILAIKNDNYPNDKIEFLIICKSSLYVGKTTT
jgi:hypothetical protein